MSHKTLYKVCVRCCVSDNRTKYVLGRDDGVLVLRREGGEMLDLLKAHNGKVWCLHRVSSSPSFSFASGSDQGVVKIYVEDTGHGIDNNIASKVMSPFFTTKSRSEGTGIGLSITKKLLNRMDGDIKLIRPNNNTTFCIEIPSAQQKAQNIA